MNATTSPKYPDIEIRLLGEDGNAFSILGRVRRAMYRSGLGDTEWGDLLVRQDGEGDAGRRCSVGNTGH